jgi:hypothetical protein
MCPTIYERGMKDLLAAKAGAIGGGGGGGGMGMGI